MNSKTLIQIILGVLILIISGLFYNYYFSQKKIETSKKEKINTDKIKKTDSSGNIIKDIIYESRDEKGNIYTIKSEYGEFNDAVSDTILMTKVSAIIKFNDGSSMTMRSENAKYDIVSYDTNFFNNVEMDYLDHIKHSNLDYLIDHLKLQ